MIVLRDTTEEHHLEQMREDLRCMLVHDLRNPLTVIDMGLSMLKRAQDQLPSDLQPVVDMAWANSSRALMLVNAILDVARLEQGRMPMEAEAISLSEIASKVVFSMTPLAWEYSVRVETVNRGALPPAWADGRLVTRIVQNLIDNAIKFSPKGGVVLVSVGELEGHPGWRSMPKAAESGWRVLLARARPSRSGCPHRLRSRRPWTREVRSADGELAGGAPYCARCFADLKQPNIARGTAPSVTRAGLCCSHAVRTGGSQLRCRPAGNPTG
jgi:hypothetical protein